MAQGCRFVAATRNQRRIDAMTEPLAELCQRQRQRHRARRREHAPAPGTACWSGTGPPAGCRHRPRSRLAEQGGAAFRPMKPRFWKATTSASKAPFFRSTPGDPPTRRVSDGVRSHTLQFLEEIRRKKKSAAIAAAPRIAWMIKCRDQAATALRRRSVAPTTPTPTIISAQLEGSGMGAAVTEKLTSSMPLAP